MKITKETIQRFEQENNLLHLYFAYGARCFSESYRDWIAKGHKIEDALWVQVLGWNENDNYVSFGFKPPKNKEVTFEYLMENLRRIWVRNHLGRICETLLRSYCQH